MIDYCREEGDETTAVALEEWRAQHDPFELKNWIEAKLKQIWELDRKLSEDEDMSELEKEGVVTGAIFEGNLRSAPIALKNGKHRPKRPIKPNPNQDTTKTSSAA